jgi:DMSO/TMAO reductase YedYZ heme-binding membrane subunit
MTSLEYILNYTQNLTLPLLLVSLGIFLWIVLKSRSVKTFQSQMSIFIIIWIIGEIANTLQENGWLFLSQNLENLGLQIHVISMIFFSIMIWLRFSYFQKSQHRLVDNFDQ